MDQKVRRGEILWRRGWLPHLQVGGHSYFVTFRTHNRILSEPARDIIASVICRGEGSHFLLSLGVILPDHVHLILLPLPRPDGTFHDLARITGSIKSKSQQLVNRLEGRTDRLWQKESYDRLIRSKEHEDTWEYVLWNPVKAGLAKTPEEYPWLLFATQTEPTQ